MKSFNFKKHLLTMFLEITSVFIFIISESYSINMCIQKDVYNSMTLCIKTLLFFWFFEVFSKNF